MGKRIIQQARGKGSNSYRVRRKAFVYRVKYPKMAEGEGTVVNLVNSSGHSAPLARIKSREEVFYIPAFQGMTENQRVRFGPGEASPGSIMNLKDIPVKTNVYCIESRPGDGGIFIKTAGSSAVVSKVVGNKVFLLMPSKKEKEFNNDCRAIVGIIAGAGRLEKPIVKAGKMHFIKKTRNKLWPRTSAVKMNAIDHPFGSGRGKNPKPKIAKRNAPPGARVGHIRPRRTGRRKK